MVRNFIFPTLILLYSCAKEKKQVEQENPDQIVYKTANNTSSSIQEFRPSLISGCDSFPVPSSDTGFAEIDVDGDSAADFIISSYHYAGDFNTLCLQNYYFYGMTIKGASAGDSVGIYYTGGLFDPGTYHYPEGKNIPVEPAGEFDLFPDYSGWTDVLELDSGFTSAYIALYVSDKYYGWLKLKEGPHNNLSITEYAVNLKTRRSIRAGQKE